MLKPTLLPALHGTRSPQGQAVAHTLTRQVDDLLDHPTRLAFTDVLTPTVQHIAAHTRGPLVVVPAFLAPGHHVRVDIPAQLARAGRPHAHITPPLGHHPTLVEVAVRRLHQAGHHPGHALILAFAATDTPSVATQVTRLRAAGHHRVSLATWLLAPGLFHDRLRAAGADVVADPLGPDPAIAHAVVERFHQALATSTT